MQNCQQFEVCAIKRVHLRPDRSDTWQAASPSRWWIHVVTCYDIVFLDCPHMGKTLTSSLKWEVPAHRGGYSDDKQTLLIDAEPTHNRHPKDPAVLKILRDSELLRRSFFTTPPVFTTVWTPLWGEKCLQNPGKWCQRRMGCHCKSLCDSKFTTRSKLTTA